jgi:hypothetical protein
MYKRWSTRDREHWSDELKEIINILLGGNDPGKPIEEETSNGKNKEA